MALRARVVTLSGDPQRLVYPEDGAVKVRINPDVEILVGGTATDCVYPIYGAADENSDMFTFHLAPGEALWADGTGDVAILEFSV